MHVEAFVLLNPRLHFGMFVRGVVVDDQMELKMRGHFAIHLLEKLQRSEQGDGAIIIMRLRADDRSPKAVLAGCASGLEPGFFHRSKAPTPCLTGRNTSQ